MDTLLATASPVWIAEDGSGLDSFRRLVEQSPDRSEYPNCAAIEGRVPIYDAADVMAKLEAPSEIRAIQAEWNAILDRGPGAVVLRGAYPDTRIVDEVTSVLQGIIEAEAAAKSGRGDHFGKQGKNARVWNAHEKLCVANPEAYIGYNANPMIALVSRAWLGPLYQLTAQVNVVYPGGAAQVPHRDYHMGFQTIEQLQHYPANAHRLSASLTLQGAIAHCDMPVESGPTKLLPYSQLYLPGYLAAQLDEFRTYFEAHFVQVPLQKGDMLYFNPALFHAAGTNRTSDVVRFANLLQIGSGYGRSIEIVNRGRMSKIVFPVLAEMRKAGQIDSREVEYVIAATAEGYPFPTDLDVDSPLTGLAPASQQDIIREALRDGWDATRFSTAIADYEKVRRHS